MKIAFVTRGFTGSVLPLMKQMIADNHQVDLYVICNRKELDDIEAFECDYSASRVGLRFVPEDYWKSTAMYVNGGRFFCLRLLRPFESVPVLGQIIKWVNKYLSYRTVHFINAQNYDMVNIVCGYYSTEYLPFIEGLTVKPVISLHEVCDHFHPDFGNPSPLLSAIFENNHHVILYSDNTYNDMLNYEKANKDNIYRINFGFFNSYLSVTEDDKLALPQKYVLFFGTLKNYKGLSVLYDAITKYDVLPSDYKCVVAGAGQDDSFEKMKADARFVCIQKRLTNGELVHLIRNSYAVICPYLTVSQSGIPQTVFVYKKPIVASRLGGFTEILNDNNSVLFETGNSEELANGIKLLLSDRHHYESIIENIDRLEQATSPFSWGYIAGQYYKLISQ